MSAHHLSQDEFFDRLAELLRRRKGADHGAVYLTQKRFSFNDQVNSGEDSGGPKPLVIRATDGKSKKERHRKVKMSTIVQPSDIDHFYTRYADVCKSGMAALKPRDRSKKKAKAKKKKTAVMV